jgi:hypothetical protein
MRGMRHRWGVAFWMTETAEGGFAMGEAENEAEARLEIARAQGRASVNWSERSMRYRWTVVVDDDKTHHGWADSESEAWWYIKEALNRPHRGTRYVRPRGLFGLPPA